MRPNPAALDALIALARLDLAAGEPARALERVDARIAAQPKDPRLHNLRGDLLMAMRRPAVAANSYAAAAKDSPSWSQPYRGQAATLNAAGQPKRAIEVLKAALGPMNDSADVASDLGMLYTLQGRPDEAIGVHERILERDPNNVIAANNLVMLLVTHRTDAPSLERAAKLVEPFAKTDDPAFLDTYAWVLYKRGRYADAIPPLERALAKVPQAQELRYYLGMAQPKVGKTAEARKNLDAAEQGDPIYLGVEQARKALGGLQP